MENSREIIISYLKSLQNRDFRQTIFDTVIRTLFFGMCFLAAISIGIRIVKIPFSIMYVIPFGVIGSVVIGTCLSFRYRKSISEIAGYVDENLTLKERVSTSLELIQENREGELVDLQILDSAEGISQADPRNILPFVTPPLLKWVFIPMVIITLSFAIPRQYELPQPPTVAEREAINNTIINLSNEYENIDNPTIREEINKTLKQLRNVKDVETAQDQLRNLNNVVRKQRSELPEEADIEQATQATIHFKGMDTVTLAEELERLAGQDELTPELRAELAKLFAKIQQSFPQGELRTALDQIQGTTVSPDKLQQIANALNQIKQLNQLEAHVIDSRKDIALASIQTEQSNGGFANNDGAPGLESGNKETQGSFVSGDTSEISSSTDDATSTPDDDSTTKPLVGDETTSLQVSGNELQLNSESASDTQTITRVFTGNAGKDGSEPEYIPFSNAVLNAQREFAQAIENDKIPVRYRSQIKAYLEAIAKIDEK